MRWRRGPSQTSVDVMYAVIYVGNCYFCREIFIDCYFLYKNVCRFMLEFGINTTTYHQIVSKFNKTLIHSEASYTVWTINFNCL